MRILLKTGVMIKVHGKDQVRAIFPTESVDFIDLENDEATDLKMEIFPAIK